MRSYSKAIMEQNASLEIVSDIETRFVNKNKCHNTENLKERNNDLNELCDSNKYSKSENVIEKNAFYKTKWKNSEISFGRRRQQFNPYKKPSSFVSARKQTNRGQSKLFPKYRMEMEYFRYGNYHQYYGYRNEGTMDNRLSCMKRGWFFAKDVLDIGCNAGHFTLSIAHDFAPRSIIGIDIDNELIKMAKKNVRHYINNDYNGFPISLALSYGPAAQALDPKCRYSTGKFPFNVQFIQGNYILPSDEFLQWQEPFFDAVLCLSLTKWIHLNWGDSGVKRLFCRVFAHLRPGGVFILEAQSFQSYARKKKITEEIFKHYNEIHFLPEMFNEYLVKEVGFKSCELIDIPAHSSKGFSRPIYLFVKADETKPLQRKSKHVIYNSDSESSCNYSDIEQFSE